MEDLQSILEKINKEGVEKADAEAKRIIDDAKAKAAAIVKNAEDAAAATKSAAAAEAEASAKRGEETLRQAARDVAISVEKSVSAILERLLAHDVDAALADEATAVAVAAEAIKELAGPGEVACGAKLAAAMKAQLASKRDFTVVTDETLGSGFSVRLDGGRVEHSFTGTTVTDELARRLRPELAKLLKGLTAA